MFPLLWWEIVRLNPHPLPPSPGVWNGGGICLKRHFIIIKSIFTKPMLGSTWGKGHLEGWVVLSFGLDLRTEKLHLRTTGAKPTNTKMTKPCLGFFSEEDGLAASRVPGGRARCLELGQGPGRRQRSGQGTQEKARVPGQFTDQTPPC